MSEETAIRTLPHAMGPEKSVLSALMEEPHLIGEAGILSEMFYLPAHQIILEDIAKAGIGWEHVSAVQRLHDNGLLDAAGGPGGIGEIITRNPGGRDFDKHVAIIRDRYARRMAIRAATAAVEAAYDCSDESDYLATLAGPITAIFDYAAGTEAEQDTTSLAREFLADFEKKLAGEETPMGTPTGISEIDQALKGLHRGQMGVISGFPNGGKSTLGTQIAANLSDDGVPNLYLAYERGRLSVFRRAIIQAARVRAAVVNDPKGNTPTNFDLMHIRDAVQKATPSLHVRTPNNRRASTCLAEIRRYHRRHGIKVVFIDQIGLLKGDRNRAGNAEEELRLISNGIQEIAQELGITIIVLCQTNAEGETKGARAIEEDADWWLSIIQERDKKKENFGQHQYVLIAKDSHNGTAGERLPLILDKENLRFVHGFPEKPETKGGRFSK